MSKDALNGRKVAILANSQPASAVGLLPEQVRDQPNYRS
jgi:hypothetical protein